MVDPYKKLKAIEEVTWPRRDLITRHLNELGDLLPELRSVVTDHQTGQPLDGAQTAWLAAALRSIVRVLELDDRRLSVEKALSIFAEHELMSYYQPDEIDAAVAYWKSEQLMSRQTQASFVDGSRVFALTSPIQQTTFDYVQIQPSDLLPNRNRPLPRMHELRGGKPPNRL